MKGKQTDLRASEDRIRYSVRINGVDVDAQYDRQAVGTIFLPLLKRLTEMQKERGRRILVMLAAPPGAGKSTLLSFLETLSHESPDLCPVQAIGMDGFHRRQEYLISHEVELDSGRVSMVQIKGAPVTFDLERLKDRIRTVASGAVCGWPVYDRLLHNPVEDAVTVDGRIVLLEGNYLLLDEDGWREASACADYTVSVRADEDLLRTRLIERRIRTGVEREAAVRFVDFSDMPNVRLCLSKMMPADLQLRLDADGSYRIVSSRGLSV